MRDANHGFASSLTDYVDINIIRMCQILLRVMQLRIRLSTRCRSTQRYW